MEVEQLIGNVASILLYIGGPIIPLLLLAIQIGRWHESNRNGNPEPPGSQLPG